jgi:hypothetical protein
MESGADAAAKPPSEESLLTAGANSADAQSRDNAYKYNRA